MLNKFLTQEYDHIVKMAEKITQDTNYREIAHYVIEQFMSHKRAEELVTKGEAMKFMSGMIWRQYHSSTSPYHKLYRQNHRVYAYEPSKFQDTNLGKDDIDTGLDEALYQNGGSNKTKLKAKLQDEAFHTTDYDYEKDNRIAAIQGILEDLKSENINGWYIVTLFERWLETPNYSELARETGIPRTSISDAVNQAKLYIKQKLKDNGITN